MKNYRLFFFIILIILAIVNCEKDNYDDVGSTNIDLMKNSEDTDFVDPYSFDYDRANKKMLHRHTGKLLRSNDICVGDDQCQKELKQCKDVLDNIEFDRLYITRLINLLLSTANFKEDADLLTGFLTVSGTKAQIEELRQFSVGKITMRQVDAILSNVITPTTNIFIETLTFIERLENAVYQYKGISIAVLTTLVILLSIKYVNWSTGKVVIVFLAVVFFFSYFVMWLQLLKDAEAKHFASMKKYSQPPAQCEPNTMSMWDKMESWFNKKDECFEYYKATEFNAFHEVTAVDALLEFVDRLILQFLPRIGSTIGDTIDSVTKNLSWPMRWSVTIILYMLIPVLILCYFVRIRFWFGPLFGLSIGSGQNNEKQRLPTADQREPIIYLSPVILERNSDGELRPLAQSTTTRSIEDNKLAIGDGDSKTQKEETKLESPSVICSSCCCKNSSRKPHIQEDENVPNVAKKCEVQSEEKGDGDC